MSISVLKVMSPYPIYSSNPLVLAATCVGLSLACNEKPDTDPAGDATGVKTDQSATPEKDSADTADDTEDAADESPSVSDGGDDGSNSASAGSVDPEGGDDDGGDDGGVESPRSDLGTPPDYALPTEPCAKVDFLFVIDNSGSMLDEQQNLLNSFPGFIRAIEDTLELEDFHVMVVDTDADRGGIYPCGGQSNCNGGACTCAPEPCCDCICDRPNVDTCNGQSCDDPDDDCESALGSGRNQSALDNRDCGFDDGIRYMRKGQNDLIGRFTCAADLGNRGATSERPMNAMETALGPEFTGPGGCNEAFIRDDAVLVVTVITDEEEKGAFEGMSTGNPDSWRQSLVDVKNGDDLAIVALGLIGDRYTPMRICEPFDGLTVGAEASLVLPPETGPGEMRKNRVEFRAPT